ncbi:hypothetical protein, partial [Candidatus Liberibacter sp.]|uniref:hypothetical protein n=1 Tax=Candidatus Liberibacter sp. TaxID=34022 RepID=UPI001C711995
SETMGQDWDLCNATLQSRQFKRMIIMPYFRLVESKFFETNLGYHLLGEILLCVFRGKIIGFTYFLKQSK